MRKPPVQVECMIGLRPKGVESGPEIEDRVLLDTGSQFNVINRSMFAKLQAKYPLTALLTQRTFPVALAD